MSDIKKENATDVAVVENKVQQPAKFSESRLAENSITDGMKLPKLAGSAVSPVPSDITYLKVDDMKPGDFINGFVWGVNDDEVTDPRTGEVKVLPCLFFLQEKNDGTYAKLRSASKALVGKVETMINSSEVVCKNRLFPYQLVFNGMKKGAANNYADWSVYPIILSDEQVGV
jgi:hypothetical protein